MRHTPASLLEMGHSFLGTRRQLILKIILPAASPVIFAGLRLGCAAGFIGAILAELLITPTGIGDIITYNQSIAEYPKMYAAIFAIIVFSVLFIELSSGSRRSCSDRRKEPLHDRRHCRKEATTRRRSIVEVRDVSKIYAGGVEALNDISLDFPEGSSPRCSAPRAAARPRCSRSSPA